MSGVQTLAELADSFRARRPVVVTIGGAVAVGKTTIANEFAKHLTENGSAVRVVSTDAFLFTNAVLADRQLLMRKGFPETYDTGSLTASVDAFRAGRRATVPVYSHLTYDITDTTEVIEPGDILIIEGVIGTQDPCVRLADHAVYIDAPAHVVRGWFVERFHRLTAAARDDRASFYHRFATLDPDGLTAVAEATWDGINGVNLTEHIAPSIANATVVITKGPAHEIVGVRA